MIRIPVLALVSLILATTSVVAGCSTSPGENKLEKISVGYSALSGNQSLLLVIKQAGIFEKQGLDAELVYVEGGPTAVKAVIANNVQFAQVAGPSVIEAGMAGAELVTVIGMTNQMVHVLVTTPSIKQPSDLKGKRLGILRIGDITYMATKTAVERLGLQIGKDVALVEGGPVPVRLQAMQSGATDGTVLGPPYITVARKMGFIEMPVLEGIEYQGGTITVSKSYLASNRDAVRKFVRAWAEGVHFYKTNREAAMKSMADFLKLEDRQVLEETYEFFLKRFDEVPYPTLPGIQAILTELEDTLPQAKTAKPEQFVDMSLVKELEDSGFINKLYGR